MQIFIILSIIFFILTIIFLFLFISKRTKLKIFESKFKKLEKEQKEEINKIKNSLSLTNRNGFYNNSIKLVTPEDNAKGLSVGNDYRVIIYVKEIDRFTNGMSKIQLITIEVVHGFDNSQYEWVKTTFKSKFSSIKKTSEIEWLESEEDLKELRKQKLEKLEQLFKN